MIDAAPSPTGRKPGNSTRSARHPDREREGSAMSSPETAGNIPGKWGLLAKYDDPIVRFLIDRNFPWLKRISNAPPHGISVGSRRGARRTTVQDGKLTATGASEVALYEAALLALSPAELRARFDQEAA